MRSGKKQDVFQPSKEGRRVSSSTTMYDNRRISSVSISFGAFDASAMRWISASSRS